MNCITFIEFILFRGATIGKIAFDGNTVFTLQKILNGTKEMMERLKDWLKDRFSAEEPSPPSDIRRTGAHLSPRPKKRAAARPRPRPIEPSAETEPPLAGRIEDAGPGKNVLIRNKYVREDTGTHETLKILDDSLVDSGEETGIDPYNTGGFDRSKNWNNRFRK